MKYLLLFLCLVLELAANAQTIIETGYTVSYTNDLEYSKFKYTTKQWYITDDGSLQVRVNTTDEWVTMAHADKSSISMGESTVTWKWNKMGTSSVLCTIEYYPLMNMWTVLYINGDWKFYSSTHPDAPMVTHRSIQKGYHKNN